MQKGNKLNTFVRASIALALAIIFGTAFILGNNKNGAQSATAVEGVVSELRIYSFDGYVSGILPEGVSREEFFLTLKTSYNIAFKAVIVRDTKKGPTYEIAPNYNIGINNSPTGEYNATIHFNNFKLDINEEDYAGIVNERIKFFDIMFVALPSAPVGYPNYVKLYSYIADPQSFEFNNITWGATWGGDDPVAPENPKPDGLVIVDDPIVEPSTVERANVYDRSEHEIMFDPITKLCYANGGLVYRFNTSIPVFYNPLAQKFEDGTEQELELIERSIGGADNFYLAYQNYKVASIDINDELYIVNAKKGTAINEGKGGAMLVKIVVSKGIFAYLFGAEIKYYTLQGQQIDSSALDAPKRNVGSAQIGVSWLFAVASAVDFKLKVQPYGTVEHLLKRVDILLESKGIAPDFNYNAPMGEYALHPFTGAYLGDDRGQKIRIHKDGKYLMDGLGGALLGADARPLYWREDIKSYVNHSGAPLSISETSRLLDGEKEVHSIITEMLDGAKDIYHVYITATHDWRIQADIPPYVLLPVKGVNTTTGDVAMQYYDFNGKQLTDSELIKPAAVDVDDRQTDYPEEFPGLVQNTKDFFGSLFESGKGFFGDIAQASMGILTVLLVAGGILIAYAILKRR